MIDQSYVEHIDPEHAQRMQNFAEALNAVSPLETAGAHSFNRMNIGLGFKLLSRPPQGEEPASQLVIPQLWFHKGLFYPFDIGLSLGSIAPEGISQGSGYIQWAVFERHALPAVALRLTHSRTFGLEQTKIESTGLQSVFSWGYRNFSAYLGLAFDMHTLRDGRDFSVGYFHGLHVQVIPASLYTVVEASYPGLGRGDLRTGQVIQAKLCMDI